MKRFLIITLLSITWYSGSVLFAQLEGLHGDDAETRMGVHAGNQLRTSFYNDGTFGAIQPTTPDEIQGEWPINSGHIYIIDGNIFVGAEVPDRNTGELFHILSENKSANVGGSTGDTDPVTGAWWTFLPLPGFGDPNSTRIAMARGSNEWPSSWPAFWPDKSNEPDDPGWRNDVIDNNPNKAAWNGYFGKNVFNADEESYFVADDYVNREFMNRFLPDDDDPDRGGLGVRLSVRGFQWSKASVANSLFIVFDIQNIGTYNHDKMVFAYKLGNNNGDTQTQGDGGDDGSSFIRELNGITYNVAWTWDQDDIGAGGWSPVGRAGGAFLESPGNPYDGIDNDNDAVVGPNGERSNVPGIGTGDDITLEMFDRGILQLNTQVVLINYADPTFPRIPEQGGMTFSDALDLARQGTYSAFRAIGDTLEVLYGVRSNKFWAGKPLIEVGEVNNVDLGENLIDDNLNGLIDESRGRPDDAGVVQYLYLGYKSKNYFTGAGFENRMLDERRDDGIDNDGDWDSSTDDVGADGLAPGVRGYPGPDTGEKDGVPTSGEPHFDKTDIDESDQLGLTNVNNYEWTSVNQYDDENYWNIMIPGIFTGTTLVGNYEVEFASGYFPLPSGTIERISMANVMGNTDAALLSETQSVALAYGNNYNFAQAPIVPTVKAIPGDNKVILLWDDIAEESLDPITGRDFEGYRIYRSTDPGFNDGGYITDARFGNKLWSIPVAQFDIVNDIFGIDYSIPTLGVQFNLGTDNGLRHYWIDTTAVNGYTYFYAVTSYDHGSIPVDPVTGMRSTTSGDTLKIDPSECAKFVAVQASGEIEKGTNVVVVRPEALVGGYVAPNTSKSGIISGPQNSAEGTVNLTVIDPDAVQNNHTYEITFKDTLVGSGASIAKITQSFTLTDSTTGEVLLLESPLTSENPDGLPIKHGFQLSFSGNPEQLMLDTLNSAWSKPGIAPFEMAPFSFSRQPVDLISGDFEILFGEIGIGTSKPYFRGSTLLPAVPVNFMIINTRTNSEVDFAFRDRGIEDGNFSFDPTRRQSDEIIFLTPDPQNPDTLIASWRVVYVITVNAVDTLAAGPGDVLTLNLSKPFLSNDTFKFTIVAASVDQDAAKEDLEKIRVVPNPYIITNNWEPQNPYANGRGEREIHFTHLPPKCTVRIFNVKGQLVNTLEHEGTGSVSQEQVPGYNGTLTWNMLSDDNLEISYGIYIYHIDAPGIGEKIGKFVVIK
jgi:hypothetical protein